MMNLMLTSFTSHEEHQTHLPNSRPDRASLLLHCFDLIQRADIPSAHHIISILTSTSSPTGDSTDRLTHHFARALSLRLLSLPPSPRNPISILSFNKLAPFLRFSHLTSNQAILDAIPNRQSQSSIQILDFDTNLGLQWPFLLQSLSQFPNPPSLHLTFVGPDLPLLSQTALRLHSFAHSLNLPFPFHFHIDISPSIPRGEFLAVNCAFFLRKLINDKGLEEGNRFLRVIKGMNPAVVTLAEKELFGNGFGEAVGYYAAMFESLEATMPGTSEERMEVERMWIGREIEDLVVGGEREGRKERFDAWDGLMRNAGFVVKPLSDFALAQARLLLRLHHPAEGYMVEMRKGCVFLGWKSKPLFSVSSWF